MAHLAGAEGAILQLTYHLPSQRLQGLVSVYCQASAADVPSAHVLPALLANIHVCISGRLSYGLGASGETEAPVVTLLGPSNGPTRVWVSAGCTILTVGLLAAGWRALVGAPAGELADSMVDGGLLWGQSRVMRLADQLAATNDAAGRIAVLEAFLVERFVSMGPDPHIQAIDRWLEFSRELSLDDLCARLDVSSRHAARLTLASHGAAPKLLAMKYRALRAAARLAVDGESMLDRCIGEYADHPHFIRDFKRFVGWTPGAFLKDKQDVAHATLAGRWQAGARRPLALWS